MTANFKLAIAPETYLRPLCPDDAAELLAQVAANREYLSEWLPWSRQTHSEADVAGFIELSNQQMAAGAALIGCIEQAGRIVGVAGFNMINRLHKKAELGYWLSQSVTGQGLMTAAVAALLQYGFDNLDLNRVQLLAAVENGASRAVAERVGFELEGVMREAEVLERGTVDLAIYSMIKSEWSPAVDAKSAQQVPKKFECPSCDRPIFNRRLTKCEFCQVLLPAELLLSSSEQNSIDAARATKAAERRRHDRAWAENRRLAQRVRMGGFTGFGQLP